MLTGFLGSPQRKPLFNKKEIPEGDHYSVKRHTLKGGSFGGLGVGGRGGWGTPVSSTASVAQGNSMNAVLARPSLETSTLQSQIKKPQTNIFSFTCSDPFRSGHLTGEV